MFRYLQKRFMSTPKIKLKVDPSLDMHAERDKILRPIFKIRDLLLRYDSHSMRLRYLNLKRKQIGLAHRNVGVKAFIKRYPNMFEVYEHPRTKEPWCRLTQAMEDMLEEEKQIFRDIESEVVLKLRKLLMMSKDRRIKAGKIDFARRSLGLPDDLATRVAPSYPQYFRVVGKSPSPFIELVAWDESIAISELERKAKLDALKAGFGDIQTRGQPLAFKITHSPGMFLKKKSLELLEKWQKLPYISPYQDYSWVTPGTFISEKRIAGVLHEILSLTYEKKALMQVLGRFREEFGLPQTIGKLVNRYPGIFYLSMRGNNKTVILREGYEREGYHKSHLIEDHPLVHLRYKYAQMVHDGPRIRANINEISKSGSDVLASQFSADESCQETGSESSDEEKFNDGDSEDFECYDGSSCTENSSSDEYEVDEVVLSEETERKMKKEIW